MSAAALPFGLHLPQLQHEGNSENFEETREHLGRFWNKAIHGSMSRKPLSGQSVKWNWVTSKDDCEPSILVSFRTNTLSIHPFRCCCAISWTDTSKPDALTPNTAVSPARYRWHTNKLNDQQFETYWLGPVLIAFKLAKLNQIGHHHNDACLLLKHHLPEISGSLDCRSLSTNEFRSTRPKRLKE